MFPQGVCPQASQVTATAVCVAAANVVAAAAYTVVDAQEVVVAAATPTKLL